MQTFIGISSRAFFSKHILQPLLESGKLKMTIPEKPSSKKQKRHGETMKYNTILFDADGTLFDYDKAEAFALKSALEKYGLPFSAESRKLYRDINKAAWARFENGEISKARLQTSRFDGLFAAIGAAGIDAALFNADYLDFLAEGAQLMDGAEEACRLLSADRALAIITNGIERSQVGRLNKSAIKPYIANIFVSEQVGYSKPAPEYFDYVFREMGLADKAPVLIVGDSLAADIKGGNDYGVDTCLYNPQGIENRSGIAPTFEIRALGEILRLC
jgi:2-haloacid dehalogenase